MKWTRPADLRAQVERLWARGELLAALVSGRSLFPRRLPCKGPTAHEMTERFDEVRAWVAELRSLSHGRVVVREVRHRTLGSNALPAEVWIDSFDEAIALIRKGAEVERFKVVLESTLRHQPALLGWLHEKPLRALELAAEWSRLLALVSWMREHPRPGIYLRQVDIPDIDTKFLEAHRGVLGELLDISLPPEARDDAFKGVQGFAPRYGFREKALRVRFRPLDDSLPAARFGQDITLDATSFARLEHGVSRVFITENEINFLALPAIPKALVLFGSGYGFRMLRLADWLQTCPISYWGDIDTHGFAILDQLRADHAHVESFLMDHATLHAFRSHWGREDHPITSDLPRLTPAERAVFDDLRDNRIQPHLRLEQERIGFGWVQAALAKLHHRGG